MYRLPGCCLRSHLQDKAGVGQKRVITIFVAVSCGESQARRLRNKEGLSSLGLPALHGMLTAPLATTSSIFQIQDPNIRLATGYRCT
jgi:hypothetical protein